MRVVVVGFGGGVAVVAVSALVGSAFGFDTFVVAWTVHFALMAWMGALVDAARPAFRGRWYRVRPWEPRVYRLLGVALYGRLLRMIGWERINKRPFDGTRASLAALDRATRSSELAHLVLAGIGTGLVAVAAAFRAWHAFGWLLVLNVVLHVYPVLLQRAVRFRVSRVAGPR